MVSQKLENPKLGDCVVRDAVRSGLVSAVIFPYSWESSGKIALIGLNRTV